MSRPEANIGKFLGFAVTYALSQYSAIQLNAKHPKPVSIGNRILQILSPFHYSAFTFLNHRSNKSTWDYVAATLIPSRYSAFHVAKQSANNISTEELMGILTLPNVMMANQANRYDVSYAPKIMRPLWGTYPL